MVVGSIWKFTGKGKSIASEFIFFSEKKMWLLETWNVIHLKYKSQESNIGKWWITLAAHSGGTKLYKYDSCKEATGFNQLVCDYYYFCCYY